MPSCHTRTCSFKGWNLATEPWTVIIDDEGRVRAKFEQFTTAEEIEAALLDIL